MKTISLTKYLLSLGFLSVVASASATMRDLKFYAGAGLDYNTYSLNSEAKQEIAVHADTLKTNGLGLQVPILGIKFHSNFGVELAYSINKKFIYTVGHTRIATPGPIVAPPPVIVAPFTTPLAAGNTERMKVSNMYLDLTGFMPAGNQIELIGGLGAGRFKLTEDSGDVVSSVAKLSWRAKIGAQYNFNSNFVARLTAAYQNIKKSHFKNIKTIGLGMFYIF